MEESYIKDLLLEETRFKLSLDQKTAIFDNGHDLNVRILNSTEDEIYFFLQLKCNSDLFSDCYFGLFRKKSDGYLYEVEPQGENRERLNELTHSLMEELFDIELLINDKILVLAIHFMIYKGWDTFVYELEDFNDSIVINNPSDFIL